MYYKELNTAKPENERDENNVFIMVKTVSEKHSKQLIKVSTTTGIYKNSALLQHNTTKSVHECFETISKYIFIMCLKIE